MIDLEFIFSWISFGILLSLAFALLMLSIIIDETKALYWSIILAIILPVTFYSIHSLFLGSGGDFADLAKFSLMIWSVFLGLFFFIAIMSISFAIASLKSGLNKTLTIILFSFFLCMFIVSAGISLSTVICTFIGYF